MFEVRVEADFCAAHFLQNYHGKRENLHGHNYKVYAHVKGASLNEGGILFDFSDFKKALRQVCDSIDHTNLNDIADFYQNPSAERIAMYIFNKLLEQVPALKKVENSRKPYLFAVDVFETATSRARYIADL